MTLFPRSRLSHVAATAVACALAATVAAGVANAQTDSSIATRFSLAGGMGSGSLTQGCSLAVCPLAFSSERTWMARIGYRDGPTVIGLEYNRWRMSFTGNGATSTVTYTWLGPSLQWYPFTTTPLRGLQLQGLLAQATFDASGSPHNLHGLGYGGGIAYDVPILSVLVLTPYAEFLGADRAELPATTIGRDGRRTATKIWFSARMTSFGVTLKFNGIP